MAENPLLPDDQLRALLALTKECVRLDKTLARAAATATAKPRRGSKDLLWPSREALLAGTILHLQPGDVLLPAPPDAVALRLVPHREEGKNVSACLPESIAEDLGGAAPRLLLGAAMAVALRAAGTDRLVMVHLDPASSEANWATALRWAQQELLPLIVICGDRRGSGAFQGDGRSPQERPGWDAVRRVTARLQLPVLSVDGEDAVAVYRVTQESVLRARSGAGPAVLWAMLPSGRDLASPDRKPGAAPVARLQRYLRARDIPPKTP